jgi:hypothetical protein
VRLFSSQWNVRVITFVRSYTNLLLEDIKNQKVQHWHNQITPLFLVSHKVVNLSLKKKSLFFIGAEIPFGPEKPEIL